jgi:hypothetical protein
MALISIQNASELLRKHRGIYWKIWDRSKRSEIDSQDQDIDLEESVDLFNSSISALTGDAVFLTFYTAKPTKRKAGDEIPKQFSVLVKLNQERNTISPSMAGIGFAEYMDIHHQNTALKMEMLKKELAQVEKPASFIDRMLEKAAESGQLGKIIELVTVFLMSKVNLTAAAGSAPITGLGNDLAGTMERLKVLDPGYKNTLAKMVEFLEKNPGQLAAVKSIIGA